MYTGITSLGLTSGGGGIPTPHPIAKTVRFKRSASAYMSFTPSVDGDRKKLVRRFRIKRGAIDSNTQIIHSAGTSNIDSFYFDGAGKLCLAIAGVARLVTTQTFRDATSWYVDVGFSLDISNPTAAEKAKILVNGEEVASYATDNRHLIADANTNWNAAGVIQYIGRNHTGSYFDGYMSEPLGANGTTTVTSYSALSGTVQIPQTPSAVYGTNGFYLAFDDGTNTTTIGEDRSGNGNNWSTAFINMTPGLQYDWAEDSPSNNFCTFNPRHPVQIAPGGVTYDGNLRTGSLAGSPSSITHYRSNFEVGSGKYYCEVTLNVINSTTFSFFGIFGTTGSCYIRYNESTGRTIYVNSVGVTTHPGFVVNDIIAFAFDVDAGTCNIYRNNTLLYAATGITKPDLFHFASQMARSSLGEDMQTTWNFGQVPFTYTPPSGYVAVCQANIATRDITTSGTFTGNGSADGPVVRLSGDPVAMTINDNPVTFGTHVEKFANGFKVITADANYNAVGVNTYAITTTGNKFGSADDLMNPAKTTP